MTKKKSRGRKKKRGSHLSPQRTFAFTRREGHRIGRPRSAESGVSHGTREALASRYPVHVVLKIRRGLPSLRARRPYDVLRSSFAAGRDRFGFRLNHYSVQRGRVGPDRCRPGPPTDPDMRNSRIRLLRLAGSLRAA
jgi:hypothetical protein